MNKFRTMTVATLVGLAACTTLPESPAAVAAAPAAQAADEAELLGLSRQKWLWMAARDMPRLEALFHPSARFVHMSRTMDRDTELEVIRSGNIEYRHADVSESSVELLGDTAVVYSRLRLLAVVGGNEVTNPFSATEVYVRNGDGWQLATLAFSRLSGD